MKVRIGFTVALVLCVGVAVAGSHGNKFRGGQEPASVTEEMTSAAKGAVASGCNGALWNHVWSKARLHIVESCIAVTGTVKHIKRESDGDDHIQLAVDPEFAKLLNEKNKTEQGNTLILEPICQGPVTQASAEAACHDFHSAVDIPKAGEKIRVVGSYVLDTNGGWMEIHPVSKIDQTR